MGSLNLFLKENKKKKENEKHVVTKSICDEKGTPVEWEFKHISSKEDESLRNKSMTEVPVTGKPNVFRPKFNSSSYLEKLLCKSIVYPNLNDSGLQDSYGVKTPEDLLYEIVDDPGEYQELCVWIQKFHGFAPLQDKVNDAKN